MGNGAENWKPESVIRISSLKEGLQLHSDLLPKQINSDNRQFIEMILSGLISWEFVSDDPRALEAKRHHLQQLLDLTSAPSKTDVTELCCALNIPYAGAELEQFIDQYAYGCGGNLFDADNPLDRLYLALPVHPLSTRPLDLKAFHSLKYAILRYTQSDMMKPLLLTEAEARLADMLLYADSSAASNLYAEPDSYSSVRLTDSLRKFMDQRQSAALLFSLDPPPSSPSHSSLQPLDDPDYLTRMSPILSHVQFSDIFIEDYTQSHGLPPQPAQVLSRLNAVDLSADKLGRIRRGELLLPRSLWLLKIYYHFWNRELQHDGVKGPDANRLALFIRQANFALSEAAFSGLSPAHMFDHYIMHAVYYGVDYGDAARLLIRQG